MESDCLQPVNRQRKLRLALIHPVLLCGGSGTRLWPLSRKSYPKQFVKLVGDESLLQSSARRLSGVEFDAPWVLTNSDFRFVALEQLSELGIEPANVLIEPESKNTASAVCACALAIQAIKPNSLMLIAPSDHVINDADYFRKLVANARKSAEQGHIVTFGIQPDRAETGYGWLELDEPFTKSSADIQPLKSFVEKPDLGTAKKLLEGKNHLWNAGIFLFSSSVIIQAFEMYASGILSKCQKAFKDAERDLAFTRLAPEPWAELEDVSIDYAIMEKSNKLVVARYDGEWSDLGDWDAVWREASHDSNGVSLNGEATALSCKNTLIHSTNSSQQVVGIGLTNTIVVSMPDAVLVADKSSTQDVKAIVADLKAKGVSQAETLPRDYRPWGWFESLAVGHRFQVKRIVVKPGAALSLQSHFHRAEHWIVVEGTAEVTIDDNVQLVGENQSVYIPLGAVHRMRNPGKLLLTLIEVQSGGYLGEDDIVRYDDIYARGQGAKG